MLMRILQLNALSCFRVVFKDIGNLACWIRVVAYVAAQQRDLQNFKYLFYFWWYKILLKVVKLLKSVKIPDEAYKAAKRLEKELEKGKKIEGVYNVSMATAISYALNRALEEIERERRFKAAAGSWNKADAEKIRKIIHENRKSSVRNLTL